MLLCKNCCRNQICNLLSLLHSLKCCTNCHLSLSIAYITAYKSVHNLRTFHVPFRILYCVNLVFCLLIWKHFLKFLLPYSVRPILVSSLSLPCRIQLHQVLCHFFNSTMNLGFCFVPLLSAQLVELRLLLCVCPGILLKSVQLGCKHIQITVVFILDFYIILLNSVNLNLLNTLIYSKSMGFVNHIVSYIQVIKACYALTVKLFLLLSPVSSGKYIIFSNKDKLNQRILEAPVDIAIGHKTCSRLNRFIKILTVISRYPFLCQIRNNS